MRFVPHFSPMPGDTTGSVDGQHASPDEVMQMLKDAGEMNANLLLNIGPLPQGAIPQEDVDILTEVGKRLTGTGS